MIDHSNGITNSEFVSTSKSGEVIWWNRGREGDILVRIPKSEVIGRTIDMTKFNHQLVPYAEPEQEVLIRGASRGWELVKPPVSPFF